MFFLLWNSGSPIRHTLFPSNFTSNEYIMNSHSPILELETTPKSVPASSPDDFMYFAPLTIGICPSVVTALGPLVVSEACPMFGYGIGIGGGGGGCRLPLRGGTRLTPPPPLAGISPAVPKQVP